MGYRWQCEEQEKMNRFHDTLICYKMSNKSTFNPIYMPYDEKYKNLHHKIWSILAKNTTTAIHTNRISTRVLIYAITGMVMINNGMYRLLRCKNFTMTIDCLIIKKVFQESKDF